jgi:lysophospholipase L1-like esterase
MKIQKDSTFLMIGDSITDAGRQREGTPPSPFEALGRGYVIYTAALLGAIHPELNIKVVNRGIGGNTVLDLESRWEKDALAVKPNWMSVMIGINDLYRKYSEPNDPSKHIPLEQFEKTYRKLLTAIRPSLKGLILLTPFYLEEDRQEVKRADTDRYGGVVKRLAREFDGLLVDSQAIFDKAMKQLSLEQLGPDRVHPTPAGHMMLARSVLDAVEFKW